MELYLTKAETQLTQVSYKSTALTWTYAYGYPVGFEQIFIHILWVNRKYKNTREAVW